MQFKIFSFAAIFGILAVAKAQVVSTSTWSTSIAPCALPCAQTAAATAGCDVNDLDCLCNSDTFWTDFQNCAPINCPITTDATTSIGAFSGACVALNWAWKLGKCARNCALQAAQAVGCAITDVACICRRKAAFLAAFFACIARNCPAQLLLAQNASTTDLVCPVVDPVPTATVIAAL